MRAVRVIPPEVRQRQNEAADPTASAWVAANAGSGKTHVLAQRVINLLLDGVQPEKILCITFTKAAAANMAKRVFDQLAEWTTFDDAKLDEAIGPHGSGSAVARRALARRLFAHALETPGGLKVHTIHAFCTQLLHQFPFEANVAARFTVLDEAEQSQLLERLTLAVLLDGAAAPDGALARALTTAMTAAADQTFRDVVREAIANRDAINAWVTRTGSVDAAIAQLSATLGVDPSESLDAIEAEYFSGTIIAPDEWPALADILSRGSKTDCEQAERFARLPALSGSERVEKYLDIFLTAQSGGRTPRRSIVTQAIGDAALRGRLNADQTRVDALLQRYRAAACRERSAALLTVAHEVLTRYANEKERRGLLDYDDLIDKTLKLLADVDAAWVHFKLDLGIDHVLVDEAQDTSHKQWDIVRRLTSEFTAGAGARSVRRTLFAVGDEKQSIYSFQDAAPKEFAEMLRYFKVAHERSSLKFVVSKFEHSFRSGDTILGAVDEVFKRREIALSVTSDDGGFPPHIALPDARASVVEIWEPVQPEPRKEIEGWDAPFDTVSETSPRVRLARRIAGTVRRMVDNGAARYGDVLILVRQRGELFEAIIRALKNQNVAVAGADRLMLTEHIAVMDLVALADALLLPEDDLALATVLRSPLFGLSDDDLFALAHDRGRLPLREALTKKSAEREIYGQAAAWLEALTDDARTHTPFTFYATLLGSGGARKNFLARLGAEANDAIDEFLNLALDYERRETPSLQGFVAWLRDAHAEVKRDMEIARDEVRVMTVHGAKGLEAPVVILPDTMTPPAGARPPRLLQLAGGATIWVGRKADDGPSVAQARSTAAAEAEDEYRRLLYVAMTRAADRLIVCGADGLRGRPKNCWYDLIRDALGPSLVAEGDGDEKILLYRKATAAASATRKSSDGETKKVETHPPPPWLRQPAPAETPRLALIAPSSAFDEEIGQMFPAGGTPADRQKALARGRLVHRLLQSLPEIPAERRAEAAARFLAKAAADFSEAERTAIVQQIRTILEDQSFAEIFAPGSRAEVPIVGRIPRPGAEPVAVAGQVDRLAVTDGAVLIADYKSDRIVPRTPDQAEAYVAQLAFYRAVLARIYPGKTVRAALIFTADPTVMELPAADMDKALATALAKI